MSRGGSNEPSDSHAGGGVARSFSTPAEFGAYYDVPVELVPWSYRKTDLLKAGRAIKSVVADLPPTKTGFCAEDVARAYTDCGCAQGVGRVPVELYLAHGAWPIPDGSRATRYVNPRYTHLDAVDALPRVTDADARRAWFDHYTTLGVVHPRVPATHFGLVVLGEDETDTKALRDAVRAAARWVGVEYEAACRRGREQMGRVWAITLAWSDASYEEIAAAYNVRPRIVETLVSVAGERGFRVPPDPSAASNGGMAFSGGYMSRE